VITVAAHHDVGIPQVPAVSSSATYVGPELEKWAIVQQWVNRALNEVPTVDGERAYLKAANGRTVRIERTPLLWGKTSVHCSPFVA